MPDGRLCAIRSYVRGVVRGNRGHALRGVGGVEDEVLLQLHVPEERGHGEAGAGEDGGQDEDGGAAKDPGADHAEHQADHADQGAANTDEGKS